LLFYKGKGGKIREGAEPPLKSLFPLFFERIGGIILSKGAEPTLYSFLSPFSLRGEGGYRVKRFFVVGLLRMTGWGLTGA